MFWIPRWAPEGVMRFTKYACKLKVTENLEEFGKWRQKQTRAGLEVLENFLDIKQGPNYTKWNYYENKSFCQQSELDAENCCWKHFIDFLQFISCCLRHLLILDTGKSNHLGQFLP